MNEENIVKKKYKRVYTLEDKQRYLNLWKTSGLKKSKFCKEHGLNLSAFSQWKKQSSHNKFKQNPWLPMMSNTDNPGILSNKPPVELKIPFDLNSCSIP